MGADNLPARAADDPRAAAEAARSLGLATVLFEGPIPEGPQKLRAWASSFPFERCGVAVETEGPHGLAFQLGATRIRTYVGRGAFPSEAMDLRLVGDDFPIGCSFLGLGVDTAQMLRGARAGLGGKPDAWGPEGTMRQLSRLVVALLEHGHAVVLNRGGDLVVDAETFVRRLGDLDDQDCQPFLAWLDVALVGEPLRSATFGMRAFGLPDVRASVVLDDRWNRMRAHEAVLFACYAMVRENRELDAGEALSVPLGVQIGAWPIEGAEGDALQYVVRTGGGGLLLEPVPANADVREGWARAARNGAPGRVAPNTYRALFDAGFEELHASDVVASLRSTDPDKLSHAVVVRRREPGAGFYVVTNGFGRYVQPHGIDEGFPHVELVAWTDEDDDDVIGLIGRLGSFVHDPGGTGTAWRPGDTLAAPVPDRGIGGFVLAPFGEVEMQGGPRVTLLLVVPLSDSEYEHVRAHGSRDWIAQNVAPVEKHGELRARWASRGI